MRNLLYYRLQKKTLNNFHRIDEELFEDNYDYFNNYSASVYEELKLVYLISNQLTIKIINKLVMIQNKVVRIIALILFYIITSLAFLGLNLYLHYEDSGSDVNLNMKKILVKSALQGLSPILGLLIYLFLNKKKNK